MSNREANNNQNEKIHNSEQTIRLVKEVESEDGSLETREVDLLEDFERREQTRNINTLKSNNYQNDDEYKEKVIVAASSENVGVKKVILGDENKPLPVYQRPKKDLKTTIRDVTMYLLMIAIVSTLVILLMNYCSKSKNDNRTILDVSSTQKSTTAYTSAEKHTETTTTLTSSLVEIETTTTATSKKANLEVPTTPKTTTKKIVVNQTPSVEKPTPTPTPEPEKPEETTTTAPTETNTPSDDNNNSEEQG